MDRGVFIQSFSKLGEAMRAMPYPQMHNPFFTRFMCTYALGAIADKFLSESALERLCNISGFTPRPDKTVGIIMAGNIPAAGFHDLLCVLACGARARVKLSSKDDYLIKALYDMLVGTDCRWRGAVEFVREFEPESFAKGLSCIIASGSDVTKEHIAAEFSGSRLLARGSRFSFAVVKGDESPVEMGRLALDMFLYCGLGCRSVSYLLVPQGYDFTQLIKAAGDTMRPYVEDIAPFRNSYIRQKAVKTVNNEQFIDGGFFILNQTEEVFPPLGCVNFGYWRDEKDICGFEERHSLQIQKKYTIFGTAQTPDIDDWEDGVNTIDFIKNSLTNP